MATIEEFLQGQSEDLLPIILALRQECRDAMPEMAEIVYHRALGYSTSGRPGDRIVYIAPKKGYFDLGFFFGANLPDPQKLLTGDGKSLRHIKIRSVEQAKDPAVRALLVSANSDGPGAIANLRKKA